MLSPHEFAVLLLVRDGADSGGLDRGDVETLLERQLVTMEHRGPDRCCARITLQGYVFLKASGHARTRGRSVVSA